MSQLNKALIILLGLQLDCRLYGVHGDIICPPSFATEVCNTNTDAFVCDSVSDACTTPAGAGSPARIIDVKGSTSLCKAESSGSVCKSFQVFFDTSLTTQPHGMTCEGPDACTDLLVQTDEVQGTITCKGGEQNKPACRSMVISAGCLSCVDENSCSDITLFQKGTNLRTIIGSSISYQGNLGLHCPSNCPAKNGGKSPTKACFSSSNMVEVQGRGIVPLDNLKIGDWIKSGINKHGQSEFSQVLTFLHVDAHTEVKYLRIFTTEHASHDVPLEITDDHFLYLHSDKIVRAKDIQIGHILKGGTSKNMAVTRIESINRQGLYAPVTTNGKIWVSGATASCYVSFLDVDGILSLGVQAQLSHMALAPLRVVCGVFASVCKNETYSEAGYSTNLLPLIRFGFYLSVCTSATQVWTIIAVAPLLLVAATLEKAILAGFYIVHLVIVGITIIVTTTIFKTSTKHHWIPMMK